MNPNIYSSFCSSNGLYSFKRIFQSSMPYTLKALCLTLFVSLAACSTTPQTLVDYDTSQDLSLLKTYRWASAQESDAGKASDKKPESAASESTKQTTNATETNSSNKEKGDLLSKRITRAVDAALQAQSITPQTNQTDFLVSQEVLAKSQTYRDTYYYDPFSIEIGHYGSIFDRCGRGRHGHSCFGSHMVGETREYTVTQRFLVLRFLNPENHQVLWKGIVAIPSNNSRQTALEYDEKIASAINALLSQFPSQAVTK